MNSTKSREVIWGGRVRAAKMNAEHARERPLEAVRATDRADAHAWSLRMKGFGGPAQPSQTSLNASTGLRLAGGKVLSVRDQSQHPAGNDQATA
jgi:hypothetical protein